MKYIFLSFLLFVSINSFAQNERLDSILNRDIDDQEIEEVVIVLRDPAEMRKLRRDVLKAYPYALRAASIIEQIEEHTETIEKKKKKRRYLKKKERILRDEFEDNLKKLTKTQGRYMVRLINRETNETVYAIIKEYKNGVNARFWQIIAKKFGSDLKSTYNPDDESHVDFMIEGIIESLPETYVERIKDDIEIAAPVYRDFQ